MKPILLGVGPHGIMRVDPKTKEVLGSWDYQVLRNWAYSRKTFVLVRHLYIGTALTLTYTVHEVLGKITSGSPLILTPEMRRPL